jgi:geranylgeranyl reductase family protein
VKRVAVLGGGPAGAMAAERLASAGMDAIVLDEKLAWEKPCGGGITYKAYKEYPFLLENDTPKKIVRQGFMSDPRGGMVGMELNQPMLIYSRKELNGMMLRRAERAGARIEKERVLGIERNGCWHIRTKRGTIDADFLVVATGARNPLKDVGTQWTAADTMVALGYYVEAAQEHIDIRFLPQFEGYIWVFPRCGHLSVGICGKGESSQALRARLEQFMSEKGIARKDAPFFAHAIPSLETRAFRNNRVAGEGWLAVGDAAGLVDPVTGEGLYYAFRSGDFASQAILNHDPPPEVADAYRRMLRHDFLEDLTFGAGLAKRFFIQRFLFSTVPARMIEFMRRSPHFREIVQDLFAGTQGYLDLKKRLIDSLNGTLLEIFMGSMLGNRVVKEPHP